MPTYNVPVTIVVEADDEGEAFDLVSQMIGDASADYADVQTWQIDEAYAADEDEDSPERPR